MDDSTPSPTLTDVSQIPLMALPTNTLDDPPQKRSRFRRFLSALGFAFRVASILGLVAVAIGAALFFLLNQDAWDFAVHALEWIREQNMFIGMAILVGLCSICTVFFVPTTFFNLGAGFLWDIWWGTLATTIGIGIGTTVGFLWGRTLARSWVERAVSKRPKLRAVDRAVEARGLLLVALLRLSPVFPLPLLSYVLGATKVSFISYVVGTVIGALPGIFLYCIIGHNMGSLTKDFSQGLKDPMLWIGVIVSVVAIVLVSLITRHAVMRITRRFEQEEKAAAAAKEPNLKSHQQTDETKMSDETQALLPGPPPPPRSPGVDFVVVQNEG